MAWNEPGKRDPWRGNQKGPDFEETLRRLRERVMSLFGGSGGTSSGSGSGGGILVALVAIVLAWVALDSWSVVNARDVGVVQRFGKMTRVMSPGFNLKWPRPIETVTKVKTKDVRLLADSVRMLTMDENIVQIDFNVQYQVSDAQKFLFQVKDVEDPTVKQAAESAVRQVIGGSAMDTILSGQGSELVAETKRVLQTTLDSYDAGIIVNEVNFQSVAPPHEVKEAFDDVTNARENKQQTENEAQAYANQIVPEARGQAARIKAEAEGFRAERIARAEGDAARFNQLVAQYKSAPEILRRRLYLETMQQVLKDNIKVLDATGGRNLINLPIDRLVPAATSLSPGAGVLLQADEAARASREAQR
ncbi:protease FtsH subunit HflK [Tahibacter aquaticus]|uniref:Protein HflK n=1 Tax=Tahibacter aquaticus TaxID=520092 RepID=A0A4R6YYL5_9GAMM|nr:FtsH protease activity modulator HflK [Tahibacter aquaticus]TDR44115.1 protease FtsH subunit HflK [Tahibacter aquaticus]